MSSPTHLKGLNSTEAIKLAKALGYTVKEVRIDHNAITAMRTKHITHQVIINGIVCEWDTSKGGCACWRVNGGETVGYKSDAINTALQMLVGSSFSIRNNRTSN